MSVPPRPDLLPAIMALMEEKGHLSGVDVEAVARRLRIPASLVYGFYNQFAEFPTQAGRPMVTLCAGPACAAAEQGWNREKWVGRLRAGAHVATLPGLARPHNPPALVVRLPGESARLVQGFREPELERLVMALERRDLSTYPLSEEPLSPVWPDYAAQGSSPWLASLAGSELPGSFGPDAVREISREPGRLLKIMKGEGRSEGEPATFGPPDALICDTVGPSPESGVDLLVSLFHPRAVAAGSLLAAAALRAPRVAFYVPWDRPELGERILEAAGETAAGTGIRCEVVRGPAYIPCFRETGVAATLQGMMLWRAASICGRDGPLRLRPPLAVFGAFSLWRVPWLVEAGGSGGEGKERMTLMAQAPGSPPRWLEVPARLSGEELSRLLEGAWVKGQSGPKAYYLEGITNKLYSADAAEVEIPSGTRRLLVLDQSVCMARWALRLLEAGAESCCGGCAPGRTAAAAAAAMLKSATRRADLETELRRTAEVLRGAEELALCPCLGEYTSPVRACLESFSEDFRIYLEGEDCPAPVGVEPGRATRMGG